MSGGANYLALMRGLGRTVAYYPAIAKHVGGAKAAIFMCQMLYWSPHVTNELGVYKSVDEWEQETGLTYREQVTARKELVARGLIIETHKRLEHRIYFLINDEAMNRVLDAIADPFDRVSRNAESAVGEVRKAHFVHTENTTEKKTSVEQAQQVPFDRILNLYNEICAPVFKKAGRMNESRKKLIVKCWNYKVDDRLVFQSAKFWTVFFNRCLLNAHWRGENERGWRASLEFLTRKDVMERVVDEILVDMESEHDAA